MAAGLSPLIFAISATMLPMLPTVLVMDDGRRPIHEGKPVKPRVKYPFPVPSVRRIHRGSNPSTNFPITKLFVGSEGDRPNWPVKSFCRCDKIYFQPNGLLNFIIIPFWKAWSNLISPGMRNGRENFESASTYWSSWTMISLWKNNNHKNNQ